MRPWPRPDGFAADEAYGNNTSLRDRRLGYVLAVSWDHLCASRLTSLDQVLADRVPQWQPSSVSKPTKVIYDIRIADGGESKRLAPIQAQAVLDVLAWAAKQATTAETDPRPPSTES